MDDVVTFEVADGVARIGLDRPGRRNAIDDRLIRALEMAVQRAEREARAGVIFGHGPHFSAGLDLAEHVERTPIEGIHHSRMWHRVFGRIERGAIPWVSALHGAVVGGGLELAAATHVRVADRDAWFALPEAQRGIFTGGGGSVRIARLIGAARMADMMLTGRVIDAATAERWGLVSYVVEPGTALEVATELAGRIAGNAPLSNFAILQALPRIQDMSAEDGLFVESLVAAFTQTAPEARERLRAFLEKRAGRVEQPR